MTALATTLQAFFTDRLVRQRQVSPNTLCAYRDTLRLLLVFASDRRHAPSKLDIDDLDASLVGAFLDDLEQQRRTACAPAMRGLLPSVPCSDTRRFGIRACFCHRARSCHSTKALRATARDLPDEAEINALLAAPDRSN